MLDILKLNLQLFGEGGGDGGDGGSVGASVGEAVGEDTGEKRIPASIPEKARKYYHKNHIRTRCGTSASYRV